MAAFSPSAFTPRTTHERGRMRKISADERPRMTLEDYILFLTSRTGEGLTIVHLNQIVSMHGFAKFYRSRKPVVVDALNSFDLLRPRRSTVSINAVAPPPGAASPLEAELTTEDVTRDIEEIGWRECPVGSILSVPARPASSSPVPLSTILPGSGTEPRVLPPSILSVSTVLPPAPTPASAEKRKRAKRGQGKVALRRRPVIELLTLQSLEVDNMATAA